MSELVKIYEPDSYQEGEYIISMLGSAGVQCVEKGRPSVSGHHSINMRYELLVNSEDRQKALEYLEDYELEKQSQNRAAANNDMNDYTGQNEYDKGRRLFLILIIIGVFISILFIKLSG